MWRVLVSRATAWWSSWSSSLRLTSLHLWQLQQPQGQVAALNVTKKNNSYSDLVFRWQRHQVLKIHKATLSQSLLQVRTAIFHTQPGKLLNMRNSAVICGSQMQVISTIHFTWSSHVTVGQVLFFYPPAIQNLFLLALCNCTNIRSLYQSKLLYFFNGWILLYFQD